MTKKKMKLAWITNDATRRASFEKQKKGLVKKVSELATLCGVEACLVVYGPQDAVEAEVWPSPVEAARVATRFRSMPVMDRWRKMTNQEGFLRQRAAKLQDQLRRQERENRELEVSLLAHEIMAGGRSLGDAGIDDAVGLAQMIDMKLKLVQNMLGRETVRKSRRGCLSRIPLCLFCLFAPIMCLVNLIQENLPEVSHGNHIMESRKALVFPETVEGP